MVIINGGCTISIIKWRLYNFTFLMVIVDLSIIQWWLYIFKIFNGCCKTFNYLMVVVHLSIFMVVVHRSIF